MRNLRMFIVLSLLSVLTVSGINAQASVTDLGDGNGTVETYINGPTGSQDGFLNLKLHDIRAYDKTVTGIYFTIRPAPTPTNPLKIEGSVDVYALFGSDGMHYMPSKSLPYNAVGYDLTMTMAVDSRRPPNGLPTLGSQIDVDFKLESGTIDSVAFNMKVMVPPNPDMLTQVDYRFTYTGTSMVPIDPRTVYYGEGQIGPGVIPEPASLSAIGLMAGTLLRRSRKV